MVKFIELTQYFHLWNWIKCYKSNTSTIKYVHLFKTRWGFEDNCVITVLCFIHNIYCCLHLKYLIEVISNESHNMSHLFKIYVVAFIRNAPLGWLQWELQHILLRTMNRNYLIIIIKPTSIFCTFLIYYNTVCTDYKLSWLNLHAV